MRRDTSRRFKAYTITVAALALAACSDDDDADDTGATVATPATPTTAVATSAPATSAPSTTASTPATSEAAGGDGETSSEFCTTVVEAEAIAAAGPDVDFEAATEEEITAAMEEFSAALMPLLDRLGESVPEEIASDLETIDSALRSSLESGEDPASQPGFVEADRALDEYVAGNCGFDVYTVRAVDYAFEDVPPTIPAGIVGFDLQNEGNEVHEMVVFRINDDVDLSIEELAQLPEDEAFSMVEFVTAAFAEPGGSDMTFQELRSGRYGMLCFVPVGTTDLSILEGPPDQAGEATADDTGTSEATMTTEPMTTGGTGEAPGDAGEMGPPHFTVGMWYEFEVVESDGGAGDTGGDNGSSVPSTTGGSDGSTPSTTDDVDMSMPSTTTATDMSTPSTTDA